MLEPGRGGSHGTAHYSQKNEEWDAVYDQWGRTAYKPISQRFKNIMKKVMKQVPMQPHKGVHQGSIGTYSLASSPLGKLAKGLQIAHILQKCGDKNPLIIWV